MNIKKFTFNPFAENTYILSDSQTNHCIIIDPGCFQSVEENTLNEYIESNNLIPQFVLLTHAHIDHILGLNFCVNKWNISVYMHSLEENTMSHSIHWGSSFGIKMNPIIADIKHIDDYKEIIFGNIKLKQLFVPGHAPGHLAFYNETNNILFSGDVLFHESIGRTDLPGGNFETLLDSIKNVIFTLPNETKIYSGHGIETTISHEKAYNPFLT